MDYNSWIADLHNRGYTSTTSLGKNEANFSDYGNALSSEIQQMVMQNGSTQENKNLQAFVASLFSGKNNLKSSDLMNKCRSAGLQVNSYYKKTSYIMDEKNSSSPGKGTKQVRTGSINIIEITDPKTGAKIVIADSNGNAAIEIEEVFLNEILTGVTSDIAASGSGGGSDMAAARTQEIEAQKALKEQQIAQIKEQNEALAKQIEETRQQAQTEIDDAEAELAKIEEETQREIERIVNEWISRYEANPDKYSKEYIDSQIASEVNLCRVNAQSKISLEEAKINNSQLLLTQINNLIGQMTSSEAQLTGLNAELQGLEAELNPQGNKQPVLNSDGYAIQQGYTGSTTMPSAKEYNEMLTALRQEGAYAQQQTVLSQFEIASRAITEEMTAYMQSSGIDNTNDARIALEEQIELERLEQERLELERLEKEKQEREDAEKQAA